MADPGTRAPVPTDRYWSTLTGDELARQVMAHWEGYQQACEASGLWQLWRNAVQRYHGYDCRTGARADIITFGGDQGELVKVNVNHYRSLLKHIHTMATQSRPAFQARATNSDYRSLTETMLAEGLLDYYLTEEGVEDRLHRMVEIGLVANEADIRVVWDDFRGREVAPQMGLDGMPAPVPKKEGDLEITVHGPWDVARDLMRAPDEQRWKIIRIPALKWDLAAQYPEHHDALAASSAKATDGNRYLHAWMQSKIHEDETDLYEFYHLKCDALPDGAHALIAADKTLYSGPLPYDGIPSYTFCPAVEIGSGTGYADGWDLLAVQQLLDQVVSVIATNFDALGISNILTPDNANLEAADLTKGLRMLRYSPSAGGEPKLLDLLRLGEEPFKMLEFYENTMETLSGVNKVARGDPPSSLKSGAALALVQSMAIQFNSGVQRAYVRALEAVGTGIIRVLQEYADTERVAEISGHAKRSFVRSWSADKIKNIKRVVVDVGSPLMRTTAGKVEIADKMLEAEMIETPTQYFQVLTTGRLDPIYEAPESEALLIRSENERLAQGEECPVLVTDMHQLHIKEHLSVLNSPDVREDQMLSGAVLAHIQQHIINAGELGADPMLAMLTGQGDLAQMASQMMAPPPGEIPPEGAPPEAGPDGGPVIPPPDSAEPPAQPARMPVNPMTGERAPAPQ